MTWIFYAKAAIVNILIGVLLVTIGLLLFRFMKKKSQTIEEKYETIIAFAIVTGAALFLAGLCLVYRADLCKHAEDRQQKYDSEIEEIRADLFKHIGESQQ